MSVASLSTEDNWKDFNFSVLQQVLDEQSSKISLSQEDGAASRKELSAKTKAFRKLTDEEKLVEVRSLLKGYQSEIDSLTTRCKYAESCFMNVYKSMAFLPDPEALLRAKQQEIDRLKAEAADAASSATSSDKDSTLARELERQTMRVVQLERQLKDATTSGASSDLGGGSGGSGGSNSSSNANKDGASGDDPSKNNRNSAKTSHDADQTPKLAERINELEAELLSTQSRLARAETKLRDETATSQKQKQTLRETLAKLATQQDYDSIKEELSGLRMRDGSVEAACPETPLEEDAMIVEDKETTLRRRDMKQLERENTELKAQVKALSDETARLRSLVGKLEDDLGSMQPSDTFSTISGWTAVPRAAPGSAIGSAVGSAGSGGSAVSKIIMQQRDRYKKRMQELEERSSASETALEQSRKELLKLRRESQSLYERVRQLQALVPNTGASDPPLPLPPKSLYETLPEQELKDLDLERRTMGMSSMNATMIRLAARGLVDARFRYGVAIYTVFIHVVALLGIAL